MATLNTSLNTVAKENEGVNFEAPKEVRVYTYKNQNDDNKRLGGAFLQTPLFKYSNLSIIEGQNGPFLSYPSRKSNQTNDEGKSVYFDRYYPASKEAREYLNQVVLDAFNNAPSYDGKISDEYYNEEDIQITDIKITLDDSGSPINGVLGTVKVTTPLMVHPFITIRQSNTDPDDFYLAYPGYKTNDTDENGKPVYQRYFQTTNKAANEYLTKLVISAVEKELNKG